MDGSMYHVKHQVSHTLFALPPSLLRLIIHRAQLIQTATTNPISPVTTIPLSNETLGE